MTQPIATARRYHVRLAEHVHGGRIVAEASFEAAGVAFAEDWSHAEPDAEIRVIVRDEDSGEERCYRIDLADGETAPCG
ncbi:MAG TPA: DUF5961 family protein [Caulobacteraceae bacterium]|jgi:hypothetical protein|nr:DUF5961 family protein [Caulobacteraceae bacterium]